MQINTQILFFMDHWQRFKSLSIQSTSQAVGNQPPALEEMQTGTTPVEKSWQYLRIFQI